MREEGKRSGQETPGRLPGKRSEGLKLRLAENVEGVKSAWNRGCRSEAGKTWMLRESKEGCV